MELSKVDGVSHELMSQSLLGQGDQKVLWRSVSLTTLMEDKSLLSEATWFNSFGAALSWRAANRIWLQSECHYFDHDVCWVVGLVDPAHDGMVSSTATGKWAERTRFQFGADSALIPLAIIQMSSGFSQTLENKAWQGDYCCKVVSDFEEIFEVAALDSTCMPCSIMQGLFSHACGQKVRATLAKHNPSLYASVELMMSNMMLGEILKAQNYSQESSQTQSWSTGSVSVNVNLNSQ
eukprot:1747634-Amphidinium_carterae.1